MTEETLNKAVLLANEKSSISNFLESTKSEDMFSFKLEYNLKVYFPSKTIKNRIFEIFKKRLTEIDEEIRSI